VHLGPQLRLAQADDIVSGVRELVDQFT